jgi:hypothetical protein
MASNSLGFHVVGALPKGQKFNAIYYIEQIIQEILAIRPESKRRHFVILADNDRPNMAWKSQAF